MKKIVLLSMILFVFSSCKNNQNNTNESKEDKSKPDSFVVLESINAAGYVYILGEEADEKRWFAVTSREVIAGEIYYYENPLVMKDYYSKELERPFDEVLFLSRVSKNPDDLSEPSNRILNKPSGKITTDKLELSIDIPKNALSISQLFEQKEQLQGQKVQVRGQVVKFSPEIMNTNWIHIQDGTSFDEKYDLTITTSETVNVGDIITFEGTVTVDKDFGYGYFYEVLLEEAKVIK